MHDGGSADAEYQKRLVDTIVHIGGVVWHDRGTASKAESPSTQAIRTETWLLNRGIARCRLAGWGTDSGLRGF